MIGPSPTLGAETAFCNVFVEDLDEGYQVFGRRTVSLGEVRQCISTWQKWVRVFLAGRLRHEQQMKKGDPGIAFIVLVKVFGNHGTRCIHEATFDV